MLQLLTASTEEIDDGEIAAQEIFTQLNWDNLDERARKNSAALIFFHQEFYDAGIAQTIIERLPMPVVGAMSHGCGTNSAVSVHRLAVAVFVADDAIKFSAAGTDITAENYAQQIQQAYAKARANLDADPNLILMYNSYNPHLNGDLLLDAITAVSGKNIPIFGGIGSQLPPNPDEIIVVGDKEMSNRRVGMLLISGDISPQFFTVVTADVDMASDRTGIVTASDGEIIYEVDNHPAWEFTEKCGVKESDFLLGLPLLVDYGDGAGNSAVGLTSISKDSVRANKVVPVGVRITLTSYLRRASLMDTAEKFIAKLTNECAKKSSPIILAYSCLARAACLAPDDDAEIKEFQAKMQNCAPFVIAYAGGEICPLANQLSQQWTNRFHHYTWSICLL